MKTRKLVKRISLIITLSLFFIFLASGVGAVSVYREGIHDGIEYHLWSRIVSNVTTQRLETATLARISLRTQSLDYYTGDTYYDYCWRRSTLVVSGIDGDEIGATIFRTSCIYTMNETQIDYIILYR